jgi:hypothetical protein
MCPADGSMLVLIGICETFLRRILKVAVAHSVFLRSVRRLLVTASFVPSSPILGTLMKEALSSSEKPQGVTSKKTPFFIVTAAKTSDLT